MRGNIGDWLAVALMCLFSLTSVPMDAVAAPAASTTAYACADDGMHSARDGRRRH